MDTLTTGDLRTLMAYRVDHCVSLYLPTHPSGPAAAQDAVRLKNLADQAEADLVAQGVRSAEARDLVRPIREIPKDEPFWLHRSAGLAVFVAPGGVFQHYRLPIEFPAEVTVNRRFHIKPLIPLFADVSFLVLELNQQQPHLYRGSRFALQPVPVSDMPGPLSETLNYEAIDGGAQVHTAMRGVEGKQGAVFHGQGGIRASAKDDLTQYLREVDHALQPVLRRESLPLVLVGVDYVLSIFRSICRYPQLSAESVIGNAEHWHSSQLLAKVWPLVARELDDQRQATTARFRELHGTGKASDNILEVTPAAAHGKVETLLIEARRRQWGQFDASSNQIELRDQARPGDEDLLDRATVETLTNRGQVIATSREHMPTDSPVAAVFRY